MKVRKVVMVSAIAHRHCGRPGGGVGWPRLIPIPHPSPTPYLVPPWVTEDEDARFKTIWESAQEIVEAANRDPEHAIENARRILGR